MESAKLKKVLAQGALACRCQAGGKDRPHDLDLTTTSSTPDERPSLGMKEEDGTKCRLTMIPLCYPVLDSPPLNSTGALRPRLLGLCGVD